MAKKIYIVQAISFEYNDDYHYPSEGGRPVEAFLNRENAEDAAFKATLSELCDSCSVLYDMDEHPFTSELLEEFGIFSNSRCDDVVKKNLPVLIGNLPREQQLRLFKELQVSLYEVVEVQFTS